MWHTLYFQLGSGRCCSQQGWMSCSAKHSTVNLRFVQGACMSVVTCVWAPVRETTENVSRLEWLSTEMYLRFKLHSFLFSSRRSPLPRCPPHFFLSSGRLSQLSLVVKIFSLHVFFSFTHTDMCVVLVEGVLNLSKVRQRFTSMDGRWFVILTNCGTLRSRAPLNHRVKYKTGKAGLAKTKGEEDYWVA